MPSSQLRAWRSAESRVDRAQDTTVRPRRLGHTDRSRHELLAQRSAHIIDPPRSQVFQRYRNNASYIWCILSL